MATKKKSSEEKEKIIISEEEKEKITTSEEEKEEKIIIPEEKEKQKYKIGSIVLVSKDADADLNGFKLFPQYKKYTYTVEAYDEKSEVYSLRRLNLLLKLKETDLMAPHEKSGSALIQKQY